MLSYKRQAFEYEEEMRIFLVPKKGNTLKIDHEKGIYQLEKFDYFKATEHIYLEPLPSGWVTKKMVKNDLSILSEKISQSVIYKKQKECEQVSFKDLEISKKEDF